jgi:hypothetical protein
MTPLVAGGYFASISAPHKEFVRFDGCHYFVVMNRPDPFPAGTCGARSLITVPTSGA